MPKMNEYSYGYKDLADNYPLIWTHLKSHYYEGLESYHVPTSIKWTRRHSRTSVKRTAKKQAGLRKRHHIETLLQKKPQFTRDKPLVLRFIGHKGLGYIADTNKGRFGVLWLPHKRLWVSGFADKQGTLLLSAHSEKSYKDALAKLCKMTWAYHLFSESEVSLYQLYESIHFDFSDQKGIKKPKDNTLRLRADKQFDAVWHIPDAPLTEAPKPKFKN